MRFRGFTFIEMVLVVTIILLIGSLSGIFANQFIAARNTSVATHVLREGLYRAETYARSGRAGSNWGIVQVGSDLVIFSGNDYATRTPERDERLEMPSRITITGLDETMFTRANGLVGGAKVIDVQGPDRTLHLSLSDEGAIQEYE